MIYELSLYAGWDTLSCLIVTIVDFPLNNNEMGRIILKEYDFELQIGWQNSVSVSVLVYLCVKKSQKSPVSHELYTEWCRINTNGWITSRGKNLFRRTDCAWSWKQKNYFLSSGQGLYIVSWFLLWYFIKLSDHW